MESEELRAAKKFELETPELICRWRLSGGVLPLANRHLRALGKRIVGGKRVSPHLIAWAKQHIEGTLQEGSQEVPDGVLMLLLEKNGQAAMTVGPYVPLKGCTTVSLAARARISQREAQATRCAPEVLWIVQDNKVIVGVSQDAVLSGVTSLIGDLAKTMNLRIEYDSLLITHTFQNIIEFDEVFLTSDEHGVVCASDASGVMGKKFLKGYQKLLEVHKAVSNNK